MGKDFPMGFRNRSCWWMSLAMSVFVGACGSFPYATKKPVGPDYLKPAIELPASLPAPMSANPAVMLGEGLTWWKAFNDPTLDALMDEAAKQSQDLLLASARIEEAKAILLQTKANAYPSVDLNASGTRRRVSENSATFVPGANPYGNDRQFGVSASYEIDFWGKFSRANEAARARLLAQETSRGVVLTTLYANIAQTYFALRAIDAQLVYAQQVLASRQETLRLQQVRLKGGVVSQTDLSAAESEVASIETSLLQASQAKSNTEAALSLLLGRKPGEILTPLIARANDSGESFRSLYAQNAVPANLPSDVLTRRPDIALAEYQLIAANADIGQARAAYYPRLSLTAALGDQSKELSTLLSPSSIFWNMIGNLTMPIFRAGAIDAQVAAANARQQQALAQYTLAVQAAFRDVHDALTNIDMGRELVATSSRRILALRTSLRLAQLRYNSGYSNYLEVLSAQRDLTQAESALIDLQRAQLLAVVSLYKAMGGGWVAASDASRSPSP